MLPNDLSEASGTWLSDQLARREARHAEIKALDATEQDLDELFDLESEIGILKVVIQTRETSPSPSNDRQDRESGSTSIHREEVAVTQSANPGSPPSRSTDMASQDTWSRPLPSIQAQTHGSSSHDTHGAYERTHSMPGGYASGLVGSLSNPISHVSSTASSPYLTPDHVSLNSSSSNPGPSRKRLLPSPNVYQNGHPSKTMRHSVSPIDSRPATPLTRNSSNAPEDVDGWLCELLGDSEDVRAQIREMRRFEQEQEAKRQDEEFARRLQAEIDGSTATGPSTQVQPAASFMSDPPRFQSHFNPTGGWRRDPPIPPTLPVPNAPAHVVPTAPFQSGSNMPTTPLPPPMVPAIQYPNLPPQRTYSAPQPPASFPQSYGQNGPTEYTPVYNISSDESDSDLSIIPPQVYSQNGPIRRTGFQQVANHPGGPSAITPEPYSGQLHRTQSYGSSPITQRSRPLPNYPPTQPYQQGLGGSSVYSDVANPVSSLMNGLSSMASAFGGSLGLPAWPGQNGIDSLPDFLSNTWDQSSSQHTRPNPYDDGYADPKETEKEIKDLVNNIRPDEELGLSDRTGSPEDMADGCGLYEHQKLGLAWMTKMEEGSNKGGILGDDMGLGKTIQAIALMVSRRSSDVEKKTNLVVAPVALMKQWENEIEIKIRRNKRLSVYLYHGHRKTTTWQQLKKFDVVLTTYGTLGAEYSRMELLDKFESENAGHPRTDRSRALPLLGPQSKFYRILLDEAQNIKNKQTKAFRAASALQSDFRFCMTGTPMMNGVEELYSLISFLKIRPYNNYTKFSAEILRPLKERKQSMNDSAMRKLQALLKAILLRRTKKSEIDGRPILTLPERTTIIEHAVMEGDQFAYYHALETKTKLTFNTYLKEGTVGNNYHSVLVLLLRLRQVCDHPHLIRNEAEDLAGTADKTPEELERIAREFLKPDVVKRLLEEGQVDCPICMDAVENSTIFTPCGHATCSECFTRVSDPTQAVDDGNDRRNNKFKCMNCRGLVDPTKVTDWNSVKKVYGKADESDDVAGQAEAESDDLSDSETQSEDDGSEDDSLDGFIAPDDEDSDADAPKKGFPPKVKKEIVSVKDLVSSTAPEDALSDGGDAEFEFSKEKGKSKATGKSQTSKKTKKKRKGKGKQKLNFKLKNPTLAQLQRDANRNLKSKRAYFNKLKEEFVSSAKIDKCVEILERIANERPGEKTIIFSQFTTFLDLMEVPLADRGYNYKRYDGTMSASARNDAVIEFTARHSCRIMLVSLKAGNSGLNLTAANNVIILDPFWNPYIEEQAIDRVHRIGQRLPVNCYRILVQNTVEDRIVEIQERKRQIIEGALDETASKGIARLTPRDLAYLFGVTS